MANVPKQQGTEELGAEELEQEGEPLPDRELVSLIDANVVIPVNAAVAANVLSEDSIAAANAEQDADVEQTTDERGAS